MPFDENQDVNEALKKLKGLHANEALERIERYGGTPPMYVEFEYGVNGEMTGETIYFQSSPAQRPVLCYVSTDDPYLSVTPREVIFNAASVLPEHIRPWVEKHAA